MWSLSINYIASVFGHNLFHYKELKKKRNTSPFTKFALFPTAFFYFAAIFFVTCLFSFHLSHLCLDSNLCGRELLQVHLQRQGGVYQRRLHPVPGHVRWRSSLLGFRNSGAPQANKIWTLVCCAALPALTKKCRLGQARHRQIGRTPESASKCTRGSGTVRPYIHAFHCFKTKPLQNGCANCGVPCWHWAKKT